MKRIAFYGGSFDPVHLGHVAIGTELSKQFAFDEFIFVPAYHAPHKSRQNPTSAYDRYTMLCLASNDSSQITVSRMEIELPEKPFSVETLSRINEKFPNDQIFFVMGADSWMDIKTWREWEKVLSLSNHVVVTRPGISISTEHVTDEIRSRIIDMRDGNNQEKLSTDNRNLIYITDSVNFDISATEIRHKIRSNNDSWKNSVPPEVAIYIEKYQIYN